MPNLRRPEQLEVSDWVAFQQHGIRGIPGFSDAMPAELRASGWDIECGSSIFGLDYYGRTEAAARSEAEVRKELARIQAERARERG